jgi:hypothetical protein
LPLRLLRVGPTGHHFWKHGQRGNPGDMAYSPESI